MPATIGVLGSGTVGEVLANGFLAHGHTVIRGSRDPQKLAPWKEQAGPNATIGTFGEAASRGELLVLAVKGTAAVDVVQVCGPASMAGKVVIDTTNPIADAPPVHGVLQYFTGPNESLMEALQAAAPDARFVKAFSSVGSASMVNPKFSGATPSMFICGNDQAAKNEVRAILDQFGWETEDMGTVEAARAIEPLAMLWCIPGFARNEWSHAFKVLHQ